MEMIEISVSEYQKLVTENAQLKEQVSQLEHNFSILMEQVKLLRHNRFGRSSEKSKFDGIEQLAMSGIDNLFNEAEATADPAIPEPTIEEVKGYHRNKASKDKTPRLPEDTPVEEVYYHLTDEQKVCPECGETMHVMGHDHRDELVIIPAQAFIQRHITETCSCRTCEQQAVEPVPMVKSEALKPTIPGGIPAPEAIAHIQVQKFAMGVPLYRQEQEWARRGINISRQTMSNWHIKASEEWFEPIYEYMRGLLVKETVVHS